MYRTDSSSTPLPHHWLVVSAWRPELAYFRRHLRLVERETSLQFSLVEVGIGLVDSAIGTTQAITSFKPDGVLLIGTAGLYSTTQGQVALGQVALAHRVCLLPDLGNGMQTFLPSRMKQACTIPKRFVLPFASESGIPCLNVACPIGITRDTKAAQAIARNSNADLENLETYAVFQAARAASLPFLAILGISNHVGPTGHLQWLKYGKQAAAMACKAAIAGFRRLAVMAPNR